MQYNDIHILSTRPLEPALIQKAVEKNILIDTVSFITTEPIVDETLKAKIIGISRQPASVAITSIHAAKPVADCLHGLQTNWKIFTIGTATRDFVSKHFGNSCLAGTAENASSLADVIIENQAEDIIFFCGNQRRDKLPEKLAASYIRVQEIVVYKTMYVAARVNRLYDAVLFFSPGAVHSFFSVNMIAQSTVLFAIGSTTAGSIRAFSNNTIVAAELPSAENLVEKAITYFANSNIINEGTKE